VNARFKRDAIDNAAEGSDRTNFLVNANTDANTDVSRRNEGWMQQRPAGIIFRSDSLLILDGARARACAMEVGGWFGWLFTELKYR